MQKFFSLFLGLGLVYASPPSPEEDKPFTTTTVTHTYKKYGSTHDLEAYFEKLTSRSHGVSQLANRDHAPRFWQRFSIIQHRTLPCTDVHSIMSDAYKIAFKDHKDQLEKGISPSWRTPQVLENQERFFNAALGCPGREDDDYD
jgi:hypothetical protein